MRHREEVSVFTKGNDHFGSSFAVFGQPRLSLEQLCDFDFHQLEMDPTIIRRYSADTNQGRTSFFFAAWRWMSVLV
jgi:hypothetical protein